MASSECAFVQISFSTPETAYALGADFGTVMVPLAASKADLRTLLCDVFQQQDVVADGVKFDFFVLLPDAATSTQRIKITKGLREALGPTTGERLVHVEYRVACRAPVLREQRPFADWIGCLAVTEEAASQRLAVGAYDASVWEMDFSAPENKVNLLHKMHTAPVKSVCWLAAGSDLLVSASMDRSIGIFDVASRKIVAKMTAHAACVSGVSAAAPDAFFSGSWDATVRFWNAVTLESAIVGTHAAKVTAVTAQSAETCFAASWDEEVTLWDARRQQAVWRSAACGAAVNAADCCRNAAADVVVTGRADGCVQLWDSRLQPTLSLSSFCHSQAQWICDVRWNAAQPHLVASASADCTVSVWDVRWVRETAALNAPLHRCRFDRRVLAVAWMRRCTDSAATSVLVCGGENNLVSFFDVL